MPRQKSGQQQWLSSRAAATYFGYSHPENLRQRLRQLRESGYVVDVGNPPEMYSVSHGPTKGKVVLMWANPKTFLVSSDAPRELLNPRRGKRAKVEGDRP
jgi:hypothetical protein